jgi:hypothetical protein
MGRFRLLRRAAQGLAQWTTLDDSYAVGEFRLQLHSWSVERRFVVVELKHDLGADGFCMKQFFATEAAFRAVLLLFNLPAEFQRAIGLPN